MPEPTISIAALRRHVVAHQGYATRFGRAGADAVEAERELERQRPDIVLCDLVLPGMSGLDLLRRLRSEETSPPVIVLGEETDVRAAVDAMREGAADFIEKQHMDVAISRRVAYLLDRPH